MITLRWLLCMILVCFLMHLIVFAIAPGIAFLGVVWWIKTLGIGLLAVPVTNYIVGE